MSWIHLCSSHPRKPCLRCRPIFDLRIQHTCVLPPLFLSRSNTDLLSLAVGRRSRTSIEPREPTSPNAQARDTCVLSVKGQVHSTGPLSPKPSPPPLTSFNLVDPPLRDGFLTLAAAADYSWTVIRYEAPVNTVTFMHCHINEHLFGGMAVVLLEGADSLPPIPEEYLRFKQYGAF